jgi:quaternary ammonium compound-resistance protein SugE
MFAMAWIVLLVAGLLELVWAVALKESREFTRLWPSVVTVIAMAASLWLLAIALRSLPLGTAYAVWTGVGAAGTAAVGMLVLGEPATALRIAGIVLIVGGIALLKLAAAE